MKKNKFIGKKLCPEVKVWTHKNRWINVKLVKTGAIL